MWDKPSDSQVIDLETRITNLEARLNATLGLLTLIRPAATALSVCGVDESKREDFYRVIDDMTSRVGSGFSVSYAEFEERISSLVPAKRGDRKFFALLIEALKLERPNSKPMLDYLTHAMALFRT
jgi:hypothetical protein